ncbi:MAG: type I restriction-modification system subunit M [Acidimicrobiia bacterium]|nr:type I restriction-modification system subunit M [Acidimicrobiia bacterium]
MNANTHQQLANFIWKICNLLRGPYKRNEYRKVILPLTVLRRFDCVLADTKEAVLVAHAQHADQPDAVREPLLEAASGLPFHNTSNLDFDRLLDDPNLLAQNLNAYINGFSENVREVIERFGFADHISRMDEKNLLYEVVKAFAGVDLSVERVNNMQMGYVFEELIRIGAEQSNEEAGEHFTPREVIRLMVSLLLSPELDLGKSHVVKTIYDPACGTGGMLSVAEEHLLENNRESRPILYGQDYNDEAWAVCKSDMLLKGQDADNIIRGDTFTSDGFSRRPNGQPWTFDYMLANPPFGVEWKQQRQIIEREHDTLGYDGRFGAGTPRINDGSLLFLQHMLSKMQPVDEGGGGGSRIGIVFNGSPLFTGDAGSGESDIRRWIIENDWLEAMVALPDQMFYNTGIATYIWVLTNRKESHRVGKVQLIDARQMFVKMRRSLGNKRHELSQDQINDITRIHGNFTDGETRDFTDEDPVTHQPRTRPRIVSKVFANEDFGYQKITVERPLRLNFAATPERIARLEDEKAFINLATSKKRAGPQHDAEVSEGKRRQQLIRALLDAMADETDGEIVNDRDTFLNTLDKIARAVGVKLAAPERKAIISAMGERDPDAAICTDKDGKPEPDTELRDTETVPLLEDVGDYMAREVLPHVPDAWVDRSKAKFGYEIPFNRHFYVYEPPRALDEIEADLQTLEDEITAMLAEVTV